jgi:hypothetical protein
MNLHNVKRIGAFVSVDCVAGAKYLEHFKKMIKEEDYVMQQVFITLMRQSCFGRKCQHMH